MVQGPSDPCAVPCPNPLLHFAPLCQLPPPQAQRGPAAPVPGPGNRQLSLGPLGCGPVAPAEESARKGGEGSVHSEDGHCCPALGSPSHPLPQELGGGTFLPISIMGECGLLGTGLLKCYSECYNNRLGRRWDHGPQVLSSATSDQHCYELSAYSVPGPGLGDYVPLPY